MHICVTSYLCDMSHHLAPYENWLSVHFFVVKTHKKIIIPFSTLNIEINVCLTVGINITHQYPRSIDRGFL